VLSARPVVEPDPTRARFVFGGRSVVRPPNRPGEGYASHGLGLDTAWALRDQPPVTLEHRHESGAWSWAFRVTQRIWLTSDGFELDMALTNENAAPMPAGLGWHPYFPRTPETTLSAYVTSLWPTNAEVVLTTPTTPAPTRILDEACGWRGG